MNVLLTSEKLHQNICIIFFNGIHITLQQVQNHKKFNNTIIHKIVILYIRDV